VLLEQDSVNFNIADDTLIALKGVFGDGKISYGFIFGTLA
jgi:hypothetical protein